MGHTDPGDTDTDTHGAPGSFVRSFQGPLGQTHKRPGLLTLGLLGARMGARTVTTAPDPKTSQVK